MAERSPDGTAYELSGPDAAPVLVLVHGLGANRQMWQWHLAALSARYRVLTYDLCGHGESAPPPAVPSLSVFSAQLRALLDHLAVARAAVAGFSLGGMINRRFAMDHPGRASALAILNSPHERSPAAQKLVEERAAETGEGGPGATLQTSLERWFTPAFRAARPEVIALFSDWILANDPLIYTQCRQVLAGGVTELIRPEPPLGQPALVMTCENDSGSTPAMSRGIAADIAGAQTIIVPRLQHLGLVEEPDLFTEPLLAFLDGTLG